MPCHSLVRCRPVVEEDARSAPLWCPAAASADASATTAAADARDAAEELYWDPYFHADIRPSTDSPDMHDGLTSEEREAKYARDLADEREWEKVLKKAQATAPAS